MPGTESTHTPSRGVKLTYDDYVLFPDDGQRHELINGEHYVTPAPILRHQVIAMNLSAMIWSYLQLHRLGHVVGSPVDVIFSRLDVVQPDVLYISTERMAEFEPSDWVKGAPNLVVEIGSPATRKRDETIKRRLYERFGVDEYWIVDPRVDAITVYRRFGKRYDRLATLTRSNGDTLTTPLFPGLDLPLATVFED